MCWQGTYSQIAAPLGHFPNPVRARSTSPTCTRTPTSTMEPILWFLPTWCPPGDVQGSRAVPSLVLTAARPWQGWWLVLGCHVTCRVQITAEVLLFCSVTAGPPGSHRQCQGLLKYAVMASEINSTESTQVKRKTLGFPSAQEYAFSHIS